MSALVHACTLPPACAIVVYMNDRMYDAMFTEITFDDSRIICMYGSLKTRERNLRVSKVRA